MKPNLKYTLLGYSVEVTPGGKTAWAEKPGGERREFTTIPGGATAQVQAHWWIHGIYDEKTKQHGKPAKSNVVRETTIKLTVPEPKGKK